MDCMIQTGSCDNDVFIFYILYSILFFIMPTCATPVIYISSRFTEVIQTTCFAQGSWLQCVITYGVSSLFCGLAVQVSLSRSPPGSVSLQNVCMLFVLSWISSRTFMLLLLYRSTELAPSALIQYSLVSCVLDCGRDVELCAQKHGWMRMVQCFCVVKFCSISYQYRNEFHKPTAFYYGDQLTLSSLSRCFQANKGSFTPDTVERIFKCSSNAYGKNNGCITMSLVYSIAVLFMCV